MLIHYILVTEQEIHLGATTEERWRWELEQGAPSAVNATDLIWVTLQRGRPGIAVTETIGLFPGRGTAERAAALQILGPLLDAAWRVVDEGWDAGAAHEHLYGLGLKVS